MKLGTLTILLVLLLVTQVHAFTPNINRYIAAKALPEQMITCEGRLLEGAVAPSKSENWSANPDFKPANWRCIGNNESCPAKATALSYMQKAIQETDPCKKAFNLGIYSTFYAFSQTPSNWIQVEPACHTKFENKIETKITTQTNGEEWQIMEECQIAGEEGTIALGFSSQDLNNLIKTINTQWINTQADADQNARIVIPIPDTEKDSIYQIIEKILNEENIKITPEELNQKTLTELFDFSCPFPTERKKDLYTKWQQLDFTGKACLPTFLAQTSSNPYTLASSCYNLGAGTQTMYNQQALAFAQWELTQYTRLGWGETKCKKMTIPIYYGNVPQFENTQQTGMDYEICETVPKNIPQGCTTEFTMWDKFQDVSYNDGLASGFLIAIVIVLVLAIIIYVIWTSGS